MYVGTFVDITMQIQNIDIHKTTFLENIVLNVIWNLYHDILSAHVVTHHLHEEEYDGIFMQRYLH